MALETVVGQIIQEPEEKPTGFEKNQDQLIYVKKPAISGRIKILKSRDDQYEPQTQLFCTAQDVVGHVTDQESMSWKC